VLCGGVGGMWERGRERVSGKERIENKERYCPLKWSTKSVTTKIK
jgi:hypothetical protein